MTLFLTIIIMVFLVAIISFSQKKKNTIKKKPSIKIDIESGSSQEEVNMALDIAESIKHSLAETHQERSERIQTRNNLKEKEGRLTYTHNCLTVLAACCSFDKFIENDYLPYVPKLFDSLQEIQKELLEIIKLDNYNDIFSSAVKMAEEHETVVSDEALDFARNPNIDLMPLREDKISQIAQNYRPYWEDVISNLKRKNAIINRRHYLVDNIPKMQAELIDYPSLSGLLDDYLQYNLDQIEILEK